MMKWRIKRQAHLFLLLRSLLGDFRRRNRNKQIQDARVKLNRKKRKAKSIWWLHFPVIVLVFSLIQFYHRKSCHTDTYPLNVTMNHMSSIVDLIIFHIELVSAKWSCNFIPFYHAVVSFIMHYMHHVYIFVWFSSNIWIFLP